MRCISIYAPDLFIRHVFFTIFMDAQRRTALVFVTQLRRGLCVVYRPMRDWGITTQCSNQYALVKKNPCGMTQDKFTGNTYDSKLLSQENIDGRKEARNHNTQ